jgi:hypothetical protein
MIKNKNIYSPGSKLKVKTFQSLSHALNAAPQGHGVVTVFRAVDDTNDRLLIERLDGTTDTSYQ